MVNFICIMYDLQAEAFRNYCPLTRLCHSIDAFWSDVCVETTYFIIKQFSTQKCPYMRRNVALLKGNNQVDIKQ